MGDMLTDNLDGSEPWHNGAPYVPTTIGHIPKCTQKAREFLKGFPAEERAAALRPFMIRYKLFPDNCKDVTTAPITIKELKGLVRSRRFEVLRCLHFVDVTRVHLTMT